MGNAAKLSAAGAWASAPPPGLRDLSRHAWPYRTGLVLIESFVALGGAAGAGQLLTGAFTPPVSDLAPLGLTSWVLPGLWLFATVAAPSARLALVALRARHLGWRPDPGPSGAQRGNDERALG
jgi:hypothetical protein